MSRLLHRLRARAREEAGFTITELVTVMGILLVVLTALTTAFVSATRAELDMNNRFQAQQEARLAVDRMRREIHCASALVLESPSSVTATLPAACPTAGGTELAVTYSVVEGSGGLELRRADEAIAHHITSTAVFSYVEPSAVALGKLRVDLAVDLSPDDATPAWRLTGDIVLRNTARG